MSRRFHYPGDPPPVPRAELHRRALAALLAVTNPRGYLVASDIGRACWPKDPSRWRNISSQGQALAAGPVIAALRKSGLICGAGYGWKLTEAGRAKAIELSHGA